MKIESLSAFKKPKLHKVDIAALPTKVSITNYAKDKSYAVNHLIREMSGISYEWYGFTMAEATNPSLITDIGLPRNNENSRAHTGVSPYEIARFADSIPNDKIINGWIHSHADLGCKDFSSTDENNHLAVLNFVTSRLYKPIAKVEMDLSDTHFYLDGKIKEEDFAPGDVTVLTDNPIEKMRLFETILGGFSYAIVIGDEGWHTQSVHHKTMSTFSGRDYIKGMRTDLDVVKTDKEFNDKEKEELKKEMKKKLHIKKKMGFFSLFGDTNSGPKPVEYVKTEKKPAEPKPEEVDMWEAWETNNERTVRIKL